MSITYNEYWKEVSATAECILKESLADNDNNLEQAQEEINDSRLHETIDGHQWIIYTTYNLSVILHSTNCDYYIDNFGKEAAGESLESGVDVLHLHIAFWAFYADVQEKLEGLYSVH